MRAESVRYICCALLLLASACTSAPGLREQGLAGDRLELKQTAFFPHADRRGAAAGLATLLYTDGVDVGPDMVAPLLPAAEDSPELQSPLLAAARHFDRVPYGLAPGPDALFKELRDGRPGLVLLNRAARGGAADWEYSAVIGFDPTSDRILLRAGGEGRVEMKSAVFLSHWRAAGQWALVLTAAGRIPATATLDGWVAASEAMTSVGKPELAEAASEAALLRWPDQVLPWVALGNARYARMNYPAAQKAYLKALALKNDNPVVHNNLALVLLERHCVDLAEQEVGIALQHETDPKLREAYARTEAKIQRFTGLKVFCPPLDADASAPIEYDVVPLNPDSPPAPPRRTKRRSNLK